MTIHTLLEKYDIVAGHEVDEQRLKEFVSTLYMDLLREVEMDGSDTLDNITNFFKKN